MPAKKGKLKKVLTWIFVLVFVVAFTGAALYVNGVIFQPKVVLSDTLDPTAISGIISEKNIIQMTPDEYAQSGPQIVENGHINIPLAINFKDNESRTIHYSLSLDDIGQDYTVMTFDGLKAGDTLLSPIDGIIEIYRGDPKLNGFFLSTTNSAGLEVTLIFSENGLRPLINVIVPAGEKSVSVPIHRGDPIGVLLSSDKDPHYNGQLTVYGYAIGRALPIIATTPDGKAIQLISG